MNDAQVYERLARVEEQSLEHRADLKEIKADVKLLLQSKWKTEGRRQLSTVFVSALTAFIAAFLSR
jgi:hypothetical protein